MSRNRNEQEEQKQQQRKKNTKIIDCKNSNQKLASTSRFPVFDSYFSLFYFLSPPNRFILFFKQKHFDLVRLLLSPFLRCRNVHVVFKNISSIEMVVTNYYTFSPFSLIKQIKRNTKKKKK